jgi:multisite-specific tRNA:(cytosine-C5)-methyltransferase
MEFTYVSIRCIQRLSLKQVRCRERKREASTPVDEPDLKKPRLADDEVSTSNEIETGSSVLTPSVPFTDGDVVMQSKVEESSIPKPEQAVPKKKGKAKGDGGFKENPYTYLTPSDPILQSCMYVTLSSQHVNMMHD